MITAEELAKFPDTFNGGDAHLVRSIEALLSLDAKNALVPHGIGGHARGLLSAAMHRLASQSRAAGVRGVAYDRELIATMLHEGASVHKFTADAIREQIRLLRDADNADAAGVRTARQPPKDAGAVPLPERYSFRTNPPLPGYAIPASDGQWCKVTDVIAYGDAREAAARGSVPANWNEDSSLETWFPYTAEQLKALEAENEKLRAAGRADAVPESWHQFVLECAKTGGSEVCGNQLSARAQELLQALHQNPPAEPADSPFVSAVRKLVIAARTSGGTSGRDDGLCAALDAVEAMLAEPAARAQVVVGEQSMLSEYVADYEYRGEDGEGRDACYTPNEREQLLIEDAILGWDEYRKDAAHPSPAHAGSGDAEALAKLAIDTVAKKLYGQHTDNHPTMHCNRFPAWSELKDPDREEWREKARRLAGGDHA